MLEGLENQYTIKIYVHVHKNKIKNNLILKIKIHTFAGQKNTNY